MISYRILQKIQRAKLDIDMALVIVALAQRSGQTAKELPIKGNQAVLMRLILRRYVFRNALPHPNKPFGYYLTTDGLQTAKLILDAEVEPSAPVETTEEVLL